MDEKTTAIDMKQLVDEVIEATGWSWAVSSLWEKGGKSRVYINDSRNRGSMGFAEITRNGKVTFTGAPGHSMFRNKMQARINATPVAQITQADPATVAAAGHRVEENLMEQESSAEGQFENPLRPDSLY